MSNKTEKIELRITEDERAFIQSKASENGFKSVSCFLKSSAKDFFIVEMDLSHFREVAKEINYIGKNINNVVHHIFAISAYSDHDLHEIQRLQKVAIDRVNQEYDYLLKLQKKYRASNMSLNDKERLIQAFKQQEVDVPKELVWDSLYEQIRSNMLYICTAIEDSPEQEEGLSDYVYEYMFDGPVLAIDGSTLVAFANDIYMFAEKIKIKLTNVMNVFEDDDWWELKEILDEYESV